MKIGILTSGGDCAGLNTVIRAIGISALNTIENVEIIGIQDGYGGLIDGRYIPMERKDFDNLLCAGGTVLGTSRQPYKTITQVYKGGKSKLALMCENYKNLGIDCLFAIGGAGTHKTAALLSREGCNVLGLPKTIDNDIYGTDVTFGFQTAVECAAENLLRLRTTGDSHGRVMIAELMGNKTGWLTLHAGIAGGADMILLPEIPFSVDAVCDYVSRALQTNRSLVLAVAEGAVTDGDCKLKKSQRIFTRADRGEITVTNRLAEEISRRTGAETRVTVFGHLQRGGTPCAYDRVLCTRLGEYAVRLLKEGKYGVTVAVHGNKITCNALSEIAGKYKQVNPLGETVTAAKNTGINFGIK